MEMSEKKFILFTCLTSILISLLYIWRGIDEGFIAVTWIIITANLVYIPIVAIWRKRGFVVFYLLYAAIVIYIGAFYPAKLYNNFTSLFMACSIVVMKPKLRRYVIPAYVSLVTIAFAINDESLCNYLIHVVRGFWFYLNMDRILQENYQRKTLNLTDDEIIILEELNEKEQLKCCTSFSKNTLTDKLKEARRRNGCRSTAELQALYNLNK